MKATQQLAMPALFVCTGAQLLAQATPGSNP
jgi:GMP synthase-like glutamine amidotransferase